MTNEATNPEPCPRHGHKGCSCCIDCGCDPCAADCAYADTTNAKPAATPAAMLTPDEADAVLLEWLAAEEDGSIGHYERFPESKGTDLPGCSDAIKADWHRVCERKWTATAALTNHAKALRERLST